MKKGLKWIIPITLVATMLTGCMEVSEIEKQQNEKVENANKLMSQTKVPSVEKSLERENIRQRILVSNDSDTLQWIYPMSAGTIIGRFPVKGKVTSGNKRLTATEGYNANTSTSEELPDEMGTYGSSGEYIFWFDPTGLPHQHKGDYFISPVPYTLQNNTILTDIDASEEQKREEYAKQMEEADKRMKELSEENERIAKEKAEQQKNEEEAKKNKE
ncbi:hypothetical protein CVD28_02005 [Bacillus sp. M6-12]|uniref:hypothetical protein n=1 Tax=Bacillus sp. M6-12 TaxID=2054166 RepID=UPI000C7941B8|nr:hypothetical protein [Bacillus sp. M6-12]PLS19206.1 hypothetical protein CVD28_02005 [Bacillus sp. M6-12]